MGLLGRLLGGSREEASPVERRVGAECKRTVSAVGEFYRPGVAKLISQHERVEVAAQLVPEPHNRHDGNAVKVMILGTHVGYLSRKHALEYQPVLALASEHGEVLTVRSYGYSYGLGQNAGHEIVMYLPTLKSLTRELEAAYRSGENSA